MRSRNHKSIRAKSRESKPLRPREAHNTLARVAKKKIPTFAVAILVFIASLLVWFMFLDEGSSIDIVPITAADLTALDEAVTQIQDSITVRNFHTAITAMLHISCAADEILQKIASLEDTGATEDKTNPHLTRVMRSLRRASQVIYSRLLTIFHRDLEAILPGVVGSLKQTLFSWVTTAIHTNSVVLAEYYLQQDDPRLHAISLMRAVNLLSLSAKMDSLFNWTENPCALSIPGASARWISFCRSSMETVPMTRLRRAASLEELIVLYPSYAPFRLQYFAQVAFMADPRVSSEATRAQLTRHRVKLPGLKSVDDYHEAALELLEFFLTPEQDLQEESARQVVSILQNRFSTCTLLMEPFGPHNITWPGIFHSEFRPPLLDRDSTLSLLTKLALFTPLDEISGVNYSLCLPPPST